MLNAEITCDDADRVNNGSAFFDGTTCSFSCKSGYVPKPDNGNLQVQCNNLKWQTPHSCAKGMLKSVIHLMYTLSKLSMETGQRGELGQDARVIAELPELDLALIPHQPMEDQTA